ncbi:MAG: hypothetical protein IT269_14795 [Saprospiraceae bacterium]|nr:hypothetical protein [Saprospiraceae bacterium]
MTPLFKKLTYKGQQPIVVLQPPDSFLKEITDMAEFATFDDKLDHLKPDGFVLIFVTKQTEVDHFAVLATERLTDDGMLWFAYPKGSSKRYKCDFNRDNGWAILGKAGFEPVRMVAIDEDWSALRFRRVDFIKTLTRNETMILSEKGKVKKSGQA